MSERKAYEVIDTACDCVWCFVLAESASKARYLATQLDPGDSVRDSFPNQLTVKRRPELDGDAISEDALVAANRMWIDCPNCGQELRGHTFYDDDGEEQEIFQSPGGQWYCSKACWEAAGSPVKAGPRYDPGICLYADW